MNYELKQTLGNHPGGNLVHRHKTIKFDMVGVLPTSKYIQMY